MVQSRVSIANKKDLIRFVLSRGLEEEEVLKLLGPGTKVTLEEVMDMGPAELERITGISGKRFKRAFAWVDLEEKVKKGADEPKSSEKKVKKDHDESLDSSNLRGSVRSDADEPKEPEMKEKAKKPKKEKKGSAESVEVKEKPKLDKLKAKEMGFIWTAPDRESVLQTMEVLSKNKTAKWPCKFYVNLKRFDLPISGFIYVKSASVGFKVHLAVLFLLSTSIV